MKYFLYIFPLLLLYCCKSKPPKDLKSEVYICTGPYSEAYHKSPNCKGLDNCSEEIIQVSLKQAKDDDRHPCHFCYNRITK